jgi:glycosyltransferase involved in cell wall biosynthesis
MAAGALVYTGGTGEDYAVSGRNAVVLETLDPDEIAVRAEEMDQAPDRAQRIRRAARVSARNYSWQQTTPRLLRVLDHQGRRQGQELGLGDSPPASDDD